MQYIFTLILILNVLVWLGLWERVPSYTCQCHPLPGLGPWCYCTWYNCRQVWKAHRPLPIHLLCHCCHLCHGFLLHVLAYRSLSLYNRFLFGWVLLKYVRFGHWTCGAREKGFSRDSGLVLLYWVPDDNGPKGLLCKELEDPVYYLFSTMDFCDVVYEVSIFFLYCTVFSSSFVITPFTIMVLCLIFSTSTKETYSVNPAYEHSHSVRIEDLHAFMAARKKII